VLSGEWPNLVAHWVEHNSIFQLSRTRSATPFQDVYSASNEKTPLALSHNQHAFHYSCLFKMQEIVQVCLLCASKSSNKGLSALCRLARRCAYFYSGAEGRKGYLGPRRVNLSSVFCIKFLISYFYSIIISCISFEY